MPEPSVSCVVHAGNAAETLERALRSVAWVDELLVVVTPSEDETLAIARRYATRVAEHEAVPRIDAIRNRYLDEVAGPWVLVLDADEALPADGEAAVRGLIAEHGDDHDVFAIPRYNTIAGQVMRGGGWYPDRQPRLFRRGMVRWPDATHVLPTPAVEARVMELEPPGCLHLHHENYRDLGHFLEKQLQYALADRYDTDPAAFSFSEYTERAYEILAARRDPRADGDLSHVLSLALAWDVVIRGLIHWDRLSPRPPLEPLAPLPAAAGYAERVRRVFGNLGFR